MGTVKAFCERTLLAIGILWSSLALGQTTPAPSVLLFAASLKEAIAFAMDAAAARDWGILSVGADAAVFEQLLEGQQTDGVMEVQRLLRVHASFFSETAGTRVQLRAEEIEWPETANEWRTDVTARYSDNLTNALLSLRVKWDRQRTSPDQLTHQELSPDSNDVRPDRLPSGSTTLGVWSYAAERYAQSRGCELTDRPTLLEASGPDGETHRVFCRNGIRIRVECHHGDCTASH